MRRRHSQCWLKPVVTNPTQLLNLYNNGMLDTQALEAMIREEAFGLVIMQAQFYPPPVLSQPSGNTMDWSSTFR